MTELRFAAWWRFGGVVIAAAVLVAAVLPAGGGNLWQYSDKLGHLLAFVGLTVWFAGAYPVRYYPQIVVVLLAFGALIEAVQSTLTHRSAEWADWYADALGVLLGMILALAGLRHWCAWLERRLPDTARQ